VIIQEEIMTALGSNAHHFARPRRLQQLTWCFGAVLGWLVSEVVHPRMTEPLLPVRFPDGGNVSIEFTVDAPDDDQPRLGAWLELHPDDPAAVMRAVLDNSPDQGHAPRPRALLHGARRPGIHRPSRPHDAPGAVRPGANVAAATPTRGHLPSRR
jgi:hypothetical protein